MYINDMYILYYDRMIIARQYDYTTKLLQYDYTII